MSDDAAAVRAEWRAEEARWSRAALEQWEHRRGLADIARECMHRGDRVVFAFDSEAWSGAITAVGIDLARVDTGDGTVDIWLGSTSPFVLRTSSARYGGHRGDTTVTTFSARLRELDGTRVRIGVPAGWVEGTLRVGRDQVRLLDCECACAYVPIGSVSWVRPVDVD